MAADSSKEDLLQKLVEAFTSLLDEPLIVAIANDHDLQNPTEYDAAQSILQDLAASAAMEEATGFNSSGAMVFQDDESEAFHDHHSTGTTSASQQTAQTHGTESSGNTSSSISDRSLPRLTSFNKDSDESKIEHLHSLFPELKEYDVEHALKKSGGDFQAALDALLNIQYLQSTGQLTKGVDGFFQPDDAPPKRKKKGKKGGRATQSPTSEEDLLPLNTNLANSANQTRHQDEISYIADRMDMTFNEVADIYYRKKCSSGATATGILDRYITLGIRAEDEASKKHAQELAHKYQHVPEKYMTTLVQVTGTISEFADDIAALLGKHFAKNPWTEKLDLNHRLTPLPREDIDDSLSGLGRAGLPISPRSAVSSPSSPAIYADFGKALQASQNLHQARRDATASAAQLRSKGGSGGLYRQAAGYYSERARELGQQAGQATSSAADLLVAQQSRPGSIDLHGVHVQDGVRIARVKTQEWWQGLGEFRSNKARMEPFTVITGLGRHSAGGVSQLRQAVAAALLQDGWRMQIETGRFMVNGRR